MVLACQDESSIEDESWDVEAMVFVPRSNFGDRTHDYLISPSSNTWMLTSMDTCRIRMCHYVVCRVESKSRLTILLISKNNCNYEQLDKSSVRIYPSLTVKTLARWNFKLLYASSSHQPCRQPFVHLPRLLFRELPEWQQRHFINKG